MTGMAWDKINQPLFDRIVDTILDRLYPGRGHAVEGRGGDEGVDYQIDNKETIFQYKYFPDGANTASRKRQIRRSFETAMQHHPKEWVLVLPCKPLPAVRAYVDGLSDDVKITIHDLPWLDNRLIDFPDLGEYFQYRSDEAYLMAMSQLLTVNPVLSSSQDVAERVRAVKKAIDASDPDWTLDIRTAGDQIIQTLVAKDPNAAQRSPISISFDTTVLPGSREAQQLQLSSAYGVTEPIRLPGAAVTRFEVTGPKFLAYDRVIEQLELLPDPSLDTPWVDTDLILGSHEGTAFGTYLARSRLVTRGAEGVTMEVTLSGTLIRMLFRIPDPPRLEGRVDFTTQSVGNRPTDEVHEVSSFISDLARADTFEFVVNGQRIMLVDPGSLAVDEDFTETFNHVLGVADDLRVIEKETRTRFRYPAELGVIERINIRNLRLMLEGSVVVHPSANQMNGKFNGDFDSSMEVLLDSQPRWFRYITEPARFNILGKDLTLPELAVAGPAFLSTDDVDSIRRAVAAGELAGHPLTLRLQPGDLLRLWLPDRLAPDANLEVTPWNLPGITQPGLGQHY